MARSRGRRSGGGGGGLFRQLFAVFFAASVAVAIWGTFSHDPATFRAQLQDRSGRFATWSRGVTQQFEDFTGIGTSGRPGGQDTLPAQKRPASPGLFPLVVPRSAAPGATPVPPNR